MAAQVLEYLAVARSVLEYGTLFSIYIIHPSHGRKMLISLADSRTNGFKKWSDAQHPSGQSAPAADIPKPRRQKDESMRLDAGIGGDGK
jgi:hypothetical protein